MAVLRRLKTLAVIVMTLLSVHWLTPALQCKSPVAAISGSKEERRNIGAAGVDGDAAKGHAANALDKLPLHFEENQGRGANGSRFIARAAGLDFSITPTEAVMHLRAGQQSAAPFRDARPTRIAGVQEPDAARATPKPRKTASLRMQLVGANRRARLTGENQLTSHTNYFIGNDPQQWRGDVTNYAQVKAEQIYGGIDVVFYGSGRQLEYDFNVAPGAGYKAIRLRFSGATRMAIDESGDLVIDTLGGQLRQHKPVAYQLVGGERREIAARYIVRREREIGFDIGTYDRSRPLIIDPVLSYSTFFGGESNDSINAVAVDAQGNAYVAGTTDSSDLAITPSAFQSRGGIRSVLTVGFVAKFDLTNNRLLYSTYLGGSPGPTGGFASSSCLAVAIDSAGNAYITGWTGAANFPITPNAFQSVLAGGSDAFVAKLNSTGSALVYSTYLGSSKGPVSGLSPLDEGLGIAVDVAGSAYVTGRTIGMDFPVTAGALKTAHDRDTGLAGSIDPVLLSFTDAFVTKLNPTGTALVYSSYLGGGGDDTGSGIKVDAAGNAYVVGATRAGNFPTSNPTQANLGGGSDAFIAKLNQDASALVYSTYVGGTSDDTGKAIAIDESGNVYVAGTTASTDLPVTAGAFQPASADVNIYKSTNGGASWALSNVGMPGNSSISQISIDPVSPSSLYASVFGRVFNSSDGGRRWKNTVGQSPSGVPTRVLAFDPKKPTTVYGVMDLGFFFPQLLRSFNGGQTWEGINHHSRRQLSARGARSHRRGARDYH